MPDSLISSYQEKKYWADKVEIVETCFYNEARTLIIAGVPLGS